MGNRERAIAFVQARGDARELARLRYLLAGAPAPPDVVADLTAGQRPDGGWPPFWAPDASSLDATCFHLAQAEQLGVPTEHPPVARAVDFLRGCQDAAGAWEEDAALREVAPPWARPGDPAAQLYLTANCGFWVAVSGEDPDAAGRAAAHL